MLQSPCEVRIVYFAETRVAVFMHQGDPSLVGESVRRFREWRKEHGLSPERSATFNILYDDPSSVPPEKYRIDLCAEVSGEDECCGGGILCTTIPAGRCAVLRHVGPDDTLGESIRRLVAGWFPASGERRRDFPVYLQRVRFVPEVPEGESVIDVFLPIA
ncbi:MAG: DNA gyrase inhibitor [Chlorobiaceae bacterium]|nr:DNA gyrase inhibitor [Chlorobiaceae bacterium]